MQRLITRYKDQVELRDGGEIPALHGARFLMVFFVAIFHWWQLSWLTPQFTLFGHHISMDPLLRSGYMWVDGMLLLSGFLCYLPHAAAREAGRPAPAPLPFYVKRFWRIVPTYLLNLAVVLLVIVLPQRLYADSGRAAGDILAHITFTHNWFPYSYLRSPLNGVLWTLAVEVQFYVLFPLLARAFRRMPLLTYLGMSGVAFAFRGYAATLSDSAMWFNQLPAFLDVYANGFVAAGIYVSLRRRVKEDSWTRVLMTVCAGAAVLVLAMLVRGQAGEASAQAIRQGQMMRRWPQSAMTALALLGLSLGLGGVRWLLGNPVTRFLSQISFQFYMWHQIVAAQLRYWGIPASASPTPNMVGDIAWQRLFVALSLVIALGIATLITFLIEQPLARRFGTISPPRKRA